MDPDGGMPLMLTSLVLTRRGNLAWDDADYLRRGLASARLAAADSAPQVISRALDRLIQEQPKPPFLVGWVMLGASIVGRANLERSDRSWQRGAVWLPRAGDGRAGPPLSGRGLGRPPGSRVPRMLAASPVVRRQGHGRDVAGALGHAGPGPGGRAGWFGPLEESASLLGLAIGLALLTKLTAVLLLGGAVVVLAWWVARPDSRSARAAAGRGVGDRGVPRCRWPLVREEPACRGPVRPLLDAVQPRRRGEVGSHCPR